MSVRWEGVHNPSSILSRLLSLRLSSSPSVEAKDGSKNVECGLTGAVVQSTAVWELNLCQQGKDIFQVLIPKGVFFFSIRKEGF